MSYKSPIDIIDNGIQMVREQLNNQVEETILKAVASVGINVDKYELIKALHYDRNQYQKGYEDACSKFKWIPFELDDEGILLCPLPDDEEEILVSDGVSVWLDAFMNDDECYLDCSNRELIGLAWMPLPEPYRTKNKNIEFNFSYKGKNHRIVVSYAYGGNDGYYWDKQYFVIIDNKPYIFLVIGSWSGWVETSNSLKQVDFDYLKNRKKENTSDCYNAVSVSDFKNDRETFEKLYKFMLDNDAKEVLEDDDNLKVIER